MPAEEEIERYIKEAIPVIKRVMAGKGKITANFYFTSDNSGLNAGIILTLIMRDRKGQQVYARGRGLRKIMKTTKFAHGTLTFLDGKLDFEVVAGNAAPTLLLKSFKKNLSQKKGLIKLRTAKIHRPQEEAVEDTEELLSTVDRERLEREEREFNQEVDQESQSSEFKREIAKLKLQEKVLGSSIKKQREQYLNTIKVGTEIREIVDEQIAEIAMLEASDHPDAIAQLQMARKRLAEATSTGSDPYEENAQSLPEEVMQSMKAAYSLSGAHIQQDLIRNTGRVREIHKDTKKYKDDTNWKNDNRVALQKELEACIKAIQNYRVQLREYLKMG